VYNNNSFIDKCYRLKEKPERNGQPFGLELKVERDHRINRIFIKKKESIKKT